MLCLFLIACIACNDIKTITADTTEKALQLLNNLGDYPKMIKILR